MAAFGSEIATIRRQGIARSDGLADPDMPHHIADDGKKWTISARTGLMIMAGAVSDLDGRLLTYDEILHRMPVE